MSEKQKAFETIVDLHKYLDNELIPFTEMQKSINDLIKIARIEKHGRYSDHEDAFLLEYAIPLLNKYLVRQSGLSVEQAKQALLTEKYKHCDDISSGSPVRSLKHPFGKAFSPRPQDIYAKWAEQNGQSAVTQSCPDLALRKPFPHKILFEGKYFRKGGKVAAQNELVKDIYQAFFYRGLPYIPETDKKPSWDYDYACLLAFDATIDGALINAWSNLKKEVKKAFWEGANIYVMILRGKP